MQDGHHRISSDRLDNPVFIIGGSRTGSEMLKTMLSASPELNFTNELYVLCPKWLHRDLRVNLRQHAKILGRSLCAGDVVDLIFSGKLYGWTWKHAETELDRDLLLGELSNRPLNIQSILTAVLRVNAMLRRKPRQGAKFPVHYAFAELLHSWYPNCRVIHTTREPRAVYASQSNKYIKPTDGRLKRLTERSRQFVHINIQVSWTAHVHAKLRHRSNYRLVRYEDVVLDAERTVTDLCNFLEVPFRSEMLNPRQYGSTFNSQVRGSHGISTTSLNEWRQKISPVAAALIGRLQAQPARTLGYDLRD